MLVVVLIIGVLAAIALPQYTKSVWKSRVPQLQTALKATVTAQEAYFLQNGAFAPSFEDLGIELLPSTGMQCGLSIETTGATRTDGKMEVILNNNTSAGVFAVASLFSDGPYKCGGVYWSLQKYASDPERKMLCIERISSFPTEGAFCRKVMGGTYASTSGGAWRLYTL